MDNEAKSKEGFGIGQIVWVAGNSLSHWEVWQGKVIQGPILRGERVFCEISGIDRVSHIKPHLQLVENFFETKQHAISRTLLRLNTVEMAERRTFEDRLDHYDDMRCALHIEFARSSVSTEDGE